MKQSFSLKHQQGASMTGIVLMIIAVGLLGKFALAVVPDYISNYQLTKLVERELASANASNLSGEQFLETLKRQMDIDTIGLPKSDTSIVTVSRNTPGALAAKIKYQTENQYYGGTYITNRFDREIGAKP